MADETLRQWGANIALWRKARGLTRDQLAEKVGVSMPTVWRWEHGQMEPRRDMKVRLARELGVDVQMIFPLIRGAA